MRTPPLSAILEKENQIYVLYFDSNCFAFLRTFSSSVRIPSICWSSILYWLYWSTKHWARSSKARVDSSCHQFFKFPKASKNRPLKSENKTKICSTIEIFSTCLVSKAWTNSSGKKCSQKYFIRRERKIFERTADDRADRTKIQRHWSIWIEESFPNRNSNFHFYFETRRFFFTALEEFRPEKPSYFFLVNSKR